MFAQKAKKDLLQAVALLAFPREPRPWEVDEAWTDLIGCGRGWPMRTRQRAKALAAVAPELQAPIWLSPR
jgi:hypothetical protein